MAGAASATAAAPRSLLPQEHGAWGQLAMPLLSGLAVARPTVASFLLAAATVLAFLAHEPWLVALGHRGERARVHDGPRALRAMLGLLAAAVATGGAGLWLAPASVRVAALAPALLGAVVVLMVLLERERTIPGELTVTTALAAAGALVAMASGASPGAGATLLAVWGLAFATTIFAVQVVLGGTRSRGERDLRATHAAAVVGLWTAGVVLAASGLLGWVVPVAVLPTALVSLGVCLWRPAAAHLRLLGWALVVSTTATLLVFLLGAGPR